jgi:hypothetical protein
MAGSQSNIQIKVSGLAIRDDGMLFPATDKVLRLHEFRPYHGDPNATLPQRLAYLRGQQASQATQISIETGAFDIGTASKEELAEFALTEYGVQLDTRRDIGLLRADVAALSGGGAAPQEPAQPVAPPQAEPQAEPQAAQRAPRAARGGGVKVPAFTDQ